MLRKIVGRIGHIDITAMAFVRRKMCVSLFSFVCKPIDRPGVPLRVKGDRLRRQVSLDATDLSQRLAEPYQRRPEPYLTDGGVRIVSKWSRRRT